MDRSAEFEVPSGKRQCSPQLDALVEEALREDDGQDRTVLVSGSDLATHVLNWTCLIERAPHACVRRPLCGLGDVPPRRASVQLPGWFVAQVCGWSQRFGPHRVDFGEAHRREAAEVLERLGWAEDVGDLPLHEDLAEMVVALRKSSDAFAERPLIAAVLGKAVRIVERVSPQILSEFTKCNMEDYVRVNNYKSPTAIRYDVCMVYQGMCRLASAAGESIEGFSAKGRITLPCGDVVEVAIRLKSVKENNGHDGPRVKYELWLDEFALEA